MRRAGLAVLILVVLAVTAYQFVVHPGGGGGGAPTAGPAATVRGSIGGEKVGLLKDPQFQKILRERYGLTVDYTRSGSIDMIKEAAGRDFLWPATQIALEMLREKGGRIEKSEILFNSPVVLYSRGPVTAALIKQGIVEKVGDTYYIVDLPKLVKTINSGTRWKELGLPELYGKVTVVSTDPTRSSSGTLFAGLLANILNGGEVVDERSVKSVLPSVKQFFARQGYMQSSSGDLFNQFLQQGMGSFPIIAGYEAQLIEFSIENAQYRDLLRKEITTLYPRPTVWSSHPFIALNANGSRLLTALQDPEIQRLAWERHGFRSGLIGVQNDPKVLQVNGVPATVQNVIPTPSPKTMERILGALAGN